MVTKERALIASTVILAACALVMTGVNVYSGIARASRPPAEPWYTVSDWRSVAAAGHRTGPTTPKVTVVVFSDYQCPACKRLEDRLQLMRLDRIDSLSLVVRHFPLPGHRLAIPAAEAAVCAAAQGRFQPFHKRLFAQPDSLGIKPWQDYALEAGVPQLSLFAACLQGDSARRIVNADIETGKAIGTLGTPTVLVNDELYFGSIPGLDVIIERHLGASF